MPYVDVNFEALHIEAIDANLLSLLHVPVPTPPKFQISALSLCGKFFIGSIGILLSNLLHTLVELIYLLFNVAIVWKSLLTLPAIQLPDIVDIQISLESVIGPFSKLVYMIEDFFGYLNFFKAISWSKNFNKCFYLYLFRLWRNFDSFNSFCIFIWVNSDLIIVM